MFNVAHARSIIHWALLIASFPQMALIVNMSSTQMASQHVCIVQFLSTFSHNWTIMGSDQTQHDLLSEDQ